MRVAVTVLPTLYCLQSLAKFAIHFLVPYDKRIGMSVIQVYFHRFIHPPPPDKMPESPVLPVKLV